MILRYAVISIFTALACFNSAALAQNLNATVLPINDFKIRQMGLVGQFGTGFCLDTECRFIITNYHVAAFATLRKIKGERVLRRYLATGANDEGATVMDTRLVGPMKYNVSRDLAVFELLRPLRHYHGMGFSLDDLQIGQEVDIYSYPMLRNPFRSLKQFHARYKGETTTGLHLFEYAQPADGPLTPGASGGIVVDRKTQKIVGILSEVAKGGEPMAMAVPIQSLADFLSKSLPFLAQSIFPSANYISAVSADLYPEFVPSRTVDALQHRPEESKAVTVLRSKAQQLADSIRNFIAIQTFAWGEGNSAPAAEAAYEIRVVDGYQRFRKSPDGKKELTDHGPLPDLRNAITTGGEWAELPQMVGTQPRLKVQQAADAVVAERLIKVFQYRADPEDGICNFEAINDFVFFSLSKIRAYPCYGEVWTDADTNILRISRNFVMSGRWKKYRAVVTYGWLQQKDEVPRLIPFNISSQIELGRKIYWCRGEFTSYRTFGSKVKILSGAVTP